MDQNLIESTHHGFRACRIDDRTTSYQIQILGRQDYLKMYITEYEVTAEQNSYRSAYEVGVRYLKPRYFEGMIKAIVDGPYGKDELQCYVHARTMCVMEDMIAEVLRHYFHQYEE